MLTIILAITSGALIHLIIYLIIFGLIFYVLWWAINKIPLPSPFKQIAQAIIVILAAIFLINLLLGLIGESLF